MSNNTIQALNDMTDFVAFERLCCDILAFYGGYPGIVPQGDGRKDGGKDAILIRRDDYSTTWIFEKIVFHFSLRKDYEKKIREDLEIVKNNNLNPDRVVFVSNSKMTAKEKDDLIAEAKKEYGWELDIYDQNWLRTPLDIGFQRHRKKYLGIDYDETIFDDLEDRLEKNKHEHPNNDDFEQGVYYRNPILHEKVKDNLKKKRRCLIVGKPGNGKTALARGIGYEFLKEKPGNRVFYLDLTSKRESCSQWLKHIKQDDDDSVLYIIDNCHNALDEVNEFIDRWHAIANAGVLFVSRPIDDDLKGTSEESYKDIIKSETVEVVVDQDTTLEVVKGLEKREKQEQKEIGDIELIYNKCEGDLHLLNFYVIAWLNPKSGFKYLSDVDEDAVLTDVYNRYLNKKPFIEQLLAIAALSQFEIQVEARWVGNLQVIDSICNEAWVEKVLANTPVGKIPYLKYFHSTPAAYLIKAASEKLGFGKSQDEYILEKLEQYLASKPSNFFKVFLQLDKHGGTELLWALFGKVDTFKCFKELIKKEQLLAISRFLWAVWKWEGKKTDGKTYQLLGILKETINDNDWLEFAKKNPISMTLTLLFLKKMDMVFASQLLALLNLVIFAKRGWDGGPTAVITVLKLSTQAGIEKNERKAFLAGLNFKDLGQRSRDVGFAIVKKFLQLTTQAGVEKSQISDFCASLDWNKLGQEVRNNGNGLKGFLFNFNLFLRVEGITKTMILQFIEGMGWEFLHREIETNMSPDILAATRELLTMKCNLSDPELKCKGIDLRDENTWFRSFISNAATGSNIDESHKNIPRIYLNKAYRTLLSQNIAPKLRSSIMDIKAWSIFINNLLIIDRSYIEKHIVPILRGYTAKQFEILFTQTDLKDISIFLNKFNPRNGIFKWTLPEGINFYQIDFITKALQTPLEVIAHFLFNFHFVRQPALCNHFAQLLDKHRIDFLPTFAAAGIKELEFFLWNLWLAFPEGVQISLLADPSFMNILVEKASQEKKEQENILAAIGALNLSAANIPAELTTLIKPASALQMCSKEAKGSPIKLIRLLGGLMLLSPNIPSETKNSYLDVLKALTFEIEIPNERYALAQVTAWLKSTDKP